MSGSSRLAPFDTLLGRLQRGRGDAVRELLRATPEIAQSTIMECLRTSDPTCSLVSQVEGYVELVVRLQVSLDPFLEWCESLPVAVSETERSALLFPFRVVGSLAALDYGDVRRFLWRYLVGGANRRLAFGEMPHEKLRLPLDTARAIVSWLADEDMRLCVDDKEPWLTLAGENARVAALVRERLACDVASKACGSDPMSYAKAPSSQQRWHQGVSAILKDRRDMAEPMLVDGLWDCATTYRQKCIAMVKLTPEVVDRLRELAAFGDESTRSAANERLRQAGG